MNIVHRSYLTREGEVPLQSPLSPFAVITSRAVPSITEEWDLGIEAIGRSQAKREWRKHATAMWQVSSHWEPQRAISLLHSRFEKVDLYSESSISRGIYIYYNREVRTGLEAYRRCQP